MLELHENINILQEITISGRSQKLIRTSLPWLKLACIASFIITLGFLFLPSFMLYAEISSTYVRFGWEELFWIGYLYLSSCAFSVISVKTSVLLSSLKNYMRSGDELDFERFLNAKLFTFKILIIWSISVLIVFSALLVYSWR